MQIMRFGDYYLLGMPGEFTGAVGVQYRQDAAKLFGVSSNRTSFCRATPMPTTTTSRLLRNTTRSSTKAVRPSLAVTPPVPSARLLTLLELP